MKLLSWNICFGGIGAGRTEYDPAASGKNLRGVAGAILEKAPDIAVLEEYRDAAETGGVIKAYLQEASYTCYCSNPGLDKNGILIALSKAVTGSYAVAPAESFRPNIARLDEIYRYRWLNLSLKSDSLSCEILGLHLPDVRRGRKGGPEAFVKSLAYKQLIWDTLLDYAREKLNSGKDAIIAGDFNTGLNFEDQSPGSGTYYLSDRMATLKGLKSPDGTGLTDAWRKFHPAPGPEDYTWFTGRSGYRLDYAFLTPGIGDRLGAVEYSHRERLAGLSDHSMLIADIRI